jgi:AraC-like DNA-binding protein
MPHSDTLALEVRRVLASRMAEGGTQIQSVARALAMSTRSLQRHLADAGLSYQQLLNLTRREAAGKCLSNPALSIGEVAYLLGYSEPVAFHHAFRRWNGVTPQSFRAQQRNDRPLSGLSAE